MICARQFFAGLLCGVLLAGCKRNPYPQITDEAGLRLDCIRLLEQLPRGKIAKEKWPKSIAALHPILVERENEDIRIWTKRERRKFASGYYIFPDPQLSPPSKGVWIRKTEFKGIYRFEMPW